MKNQVLISSLAYNWSKKRVLIVFLIFPFITFSQTRLADLASILRAKNFEGTLYYIKPQYKLIGFPEDIRCYDATHNFLWYHKNICIQLDGSGKLFQINKNDSISRIDKTCYEGYNFDAFHFVYQDTLFSVGGYGFWHVNGLLRFFDDRIGEWSVIPTNNYVPIRNNQSSQVYYDVGAGNVYVIYFIADGENTLIGAKTDKSVFVQCLNLKTKKWWDNPKLFNNGIIGDRKWLDGANFHTKYGLLQRRTNDLLMFDFKNNTVGKLDNPTQQSIISALTSSIPWIMYADNEGVNFFNPLEGTTQSVKIQPNNIIPINESIYTEPPVQILPSILPNKFSGALIGMLLTFLAIGGFYYVKLRRRLKDLADNNDEIETKRSEEVEVKHNLPFRDSLNDTERILLDLISTNSKTDTMTSVSQINYALGLSKRPLKIQNNIRAANIFMINKKFMAYSDLKDDLIQKERTEFDKRFFEYYIPKKFLTKIK